MPASQNVSVYLDQDLADEVAAAKTAGTLDVKEVLKQALRDALHPQEPQAADNDLDAVAYRDSLLDKARLADQAKATLISLLGFDEEVADTGWPTIVEIVANTVESEMRLRAKRLPDAQGPAPFPAPVEYELRWFEDETSANVGMQSITELDQPGQVLSMSVSPDARLLALIAWPVAEG